MESGTFYVCRNVNNRPAPRTQSRSQDEGKARKQRGSRCLVLMAVSLGLICVLLLVFIILQNITITAERDLIKSYKNTAEGFSKTINNLKIEKHQLQNNFSSLSQKKVELETRVQNLTAEKNQLQSNFSSLSQKNLELESSITSLNDELKKEESKKRNLCGPVCYFISNEEKSWSDSRQYCKDHGADLIIIKSEEKQRSILSLTTERVWIGLSDREQEGNMKWVDNSLLEQGFWLNDEPNDGAGIEDCIELNYNRQQSGWSPLNSWNDATCTVKKKGICEK